MLVGNLPDSTPATQPSSIYDFSLLTPPLSYACSDDVPFKPDTLDHISLGMRRYCGRGKQDHRRRRNRACVSNNELCSGDAKEDANSHSITRPISMPSLRTTLSIPVSRKSTVRSKKNANRRRWTLPSKAAATRVLDVTDMSEKKAMTSSGESCNAIDSPAIITLRRATTSRSRPRLSLTFFPTPKFSRTKTGLLSAFLDTMMGLDYSPATQTSGARDAISPPKRGQSQMDVGNQINSESSTRAPPVCTEVVNIQSSLSQPGHFPTPRDTRRYSTRYMSDGSIYEVLWDETASSVDSGTTPSSAELAIVPRRGSVAVAALETQMFRAVAQSRRSSAQAQTMALGAGDMHQQKAFEDLLNFSFTRFATEAALKQLPRSRGHASKQQKHVSADEPDHNTSSHSKQREVTPTSDIEFFPPLANQNRKSTNGSNSLQCSKQNDTTMPTNSEHPSTHAGVKSVIYNSSTAPQADDRPDRPVVEGISDTSCGVTRETGSRRTSTWVQAWRRSGNNAVTEDKVPLLSAAANGV